MSSFSLALVAAFFWGMSALLEKWGLRNADPMAGVVARTLGILLGVVIFMVLAPELPRRFIQMDGRSKLALMGGGMMASIVAQVFFYRALKDGDVGRVSAVGGAWPVFAFVLSVLIFHEPLTRGKVFGVVLVTMGVFLLK
ncbi:MAG: DMT family transporter [Elusimicrobia bacterium]|nr:DMT family transporter [Elusimicrobiota bacterium]